MNPRPNSRRLNRKAHTAPCDKTSEPFGKLLVVSMIAVDSVMRPFASWAEVRAIVVLPCSHEFQHILSALWFSDVRRPMPRLRSFRHGFIRDR
jgi:hypothetical protein